MHTFEITTVYLFGDGSRADPESDLDPLLLLPGRSKRSQAAVTDKCSFYQQVYRLQRTDHILS